LKLGFGYNLIQRANVFLLFFLNFVILSIFVPQLLTTSYSIVENAKAQVLQNYSSSVNPRNVYVVWQDNTFDNYEVFFAVSTDNGKTFGDIINISNDTGNSMDPEVLSSGNNVYVVWRDNIFGNYDIFFSKSTDNGKTFGDRINISNDTGYSAFPRILSIKDMIYVVWPSEISPLINDILFAVSTDNGKTFDKAINLSNSSGDSVVPKISSSGNNIFVLWEEERSPYSYDIFFTRSTDYGKTFSDPKNLSNNTGNSDGSKIFSSDNNVYVTWLNNNTGNYEIFFTRSTDYGKTFSDPINLSNNSGSSTDPNIVSSGNNVYVTWYDNTPGNGDILFAKSTDNGKTFDKAINLSNNIRYSYSPQISSSGNNVYVTWYDNSPDIYDIFFVKSTDNGKTFGDAINLSNNSGSSTDPNIVSSGNNVYVTWFDDTPPGIGDIFFTRSTDYGKTFSDPKNLSNNTENSIFQDISIK